MRNTCTIILVIFLISLCLVGCEDNKNYSFEDEAIIAYVNGEKVTADKMYAFINLFPQIDEHQLNGFIEQSFEFDMSAFGSDDYAQLNKYYDSLNLQYAIAIYSKTNGYTDDNWEEYFYKLVVKRQYLKSDSNRNYDIQVNALSEQLTNQIKQNYATGRSDDIRVQLVENLAEENGITFDECAENFFKKYIEFAFVAEAFPKDITDIADIKKVELAFPKYGDEITIEHWNNIDDYFSYQTRLMEEYDIWMTEVYNDSDIVLRP